MAVFYDLNLTGVGLETKALSLGYAFAKPAALTELKTQADLKSVAKKGVACVESSNTELLRSTVKRDYQALLINPSKVPNYFRDDGLVRAVGDNPDANAAFEIPYFDFLSTKFVYRARLIAQTRAFLKLCLKLHAPFVITSRAKNEFFLKSPREAAAIGVFYGLSIEQALRALSKTPESMLEAVV